MIGNIIMKLIKYFLGTKFINLEKNLKFSSQLLIAWWYYFAIYYRIGNDNIICKLQLMQNLNDFH